MENYPVSSASESSHGMPYCELWIDEHLRLLFHFESWKSKCVFPHGVSVLVAIAIKRHPSDRARSATNVSRKSVQLDVQMSPFKEPDEQTRQKSAVRPGGRDPSNVHEHMKL